MSEHDCSHVTEDELLEVHERHLEAYFEARMPIPVVRDPLGYVIAETDEYGELVILLGNLSDVHFSAIEAEMILGMIREDSDRHPAAKVFAVYPVR